MGKTEVSDIKTDKVAVVFFILIAVSLFFAYPRALFYPPGIGNESHWLNWFGSTKVSLEDVAIPFFVRFPIEIIVGALSLFFLISSAVSFKEKPRKVIMSLVLFLLAIGGSVMVNGGLPEDVLEKLNYLLVPLAIAFGVLKSGIFSTTREKVFVGGFTLLWLVSVLWSLISQRPVGISGNQNWFSAVIIVTSPWAFFFFYHIFRRLLSRFFIKVNENIPAAMLSLLVVVPITFFWLIKCKSRAAWLALVFYVLFIFFLKLNAKWKLIGFIMSGLLAVVLFFSFQGFLKSAYRDDIRGPLWLNTVSMVLKSPGVGWGPGKFQERYLQFKSREHSSRLVAGLMTEHPHNEFLYIASEIGLPSACIWLALMISLVFIKVRTREGHLAKFGFIVLLFMSMFDKTLISPPGNILFWIFSGLLAARWLKRVLVFEKPSKMWLGSIALASICCVIPITLRAKAIYSAKEIHRKTALLEKSIGMSRLQGQQRKNFYKKVYDAYLSAYDLNPFEIEYPYLALHIAVEILNDSKLAEFPLERCLEINKYYGHVNYLGALYHFKKMQENKSDKALADQHLKLAEKFIAIESTLYPDNLASLSHVMEFFIKSGNRDSANHLFSVINDRALRMFNRKHASDQEEGAALLNSWVSSVMKANEGSVSIAQEILSGFKGTGYLDVLTPRYAPSDGFMRAHDHTKFHESDFQYWREIEKFTEFYKSERSAESMCRAIMNSVEISSDYKFKWPSEVLEDKEGNDLSLACLMRVAAHCQGHLSFLVKVQTLDKVHWLVYVKNEKEEFICIPGAKKIIHQKIAKVLGEFKFIEEVIGDKIKKLGLYLFEYPQAFCFRNVLLSKIVNRATGKFPDFCSTPSVVKLNLESFLGNKLAIEYLRQPFHRMEDDIKQDSK